MEENVQVISLARSTTRRAAFSSQNSHIRYRFFDAVDGNLVRPLASHIPELFDARLAYREGAYGCALSHRTLWLRVVADEKPMTIVEDDAILRNDFHAMSEATIAGLPADWDIILHGWNFDSILSVKAMPSMSPVVMLFDQAGLRNSIDRFKRLSDRPLAYRLETGFGTLAYSLSPAGARKLLAQCFPLSPFTWHCSGLHRAIPNIGIDVAMNRCYPNMNAFCSFPPLAVSRNVMEESTIGPR